MWKTVKLGDVCYFQGGSQPPKKEFVYEEQKGYVRFIQIRDFKSDKNLTYIPVSNKNRLCRTDDIFIGRYGASVGQILRGLKGAYNVALMKTIPNEEFISKGWLFAYLNSSLFQKPLKEVSSRSAQNGFSKDDISSFELPLPPLTEQQRIVAKLDTAFAEIDRAVEDNKSKLDACNTLANNTISNILKKFQRQNSTNTLLGEVTYTSGRIGWKGLTKKEYVDQGYVFLSVHGLNYGKFVDFRDAFRITKERFEESPEIMLEQGDVLLCKDGAGIGKLAIVNSLEEPATINSSLLLIRPNDSLCSEYLYYYLLASEFQSLIHAKIDGATTPHLYQRDIKNLPITFPSAELQKEAVSEIEAALHKVETIRSTGSKNITNYLALKSAILAQELQSSEAA